MSHLHHLLLTHVPEQRDRDYPSSLCTAVTRFPEHLTSFPKVEGPEKSLNIATSEIPFPHAVMRLY